MSKLLVVFGATGQQGSSVITHVLSDPVLSAEFSIRAITRDSTKPEALALQAKGVEVVTADLDDPASISAALKGAHTIFGVTFTIYGPLAASYATELAQGKSLADAAVTSGASYLIWSSSTNVTQVSGGTLKNVTSFDVKAHVEEYIRTLPIKSAFFTPGSFMQNFHGHGPWAPRPTSNGSHAIVNVLHPGTEIPLIDVAGDTGKFVGAILASPEEYVGKVLAAATRGYKVEEIVEIISKVTGKQVVYNQVPVDVLKGFLPEVVADMMVDMMLYLRDFEYYGKGTGEKVEWSAGQARGELTKFEDYVRENVKLE